MHLLAAQPGAAADGSEAVDLGQTPGDVVVLSAAESELGCLVKAQARLESPPALRLASLLQLGHNMSVDLYAEDVLAEAKLVIVRLLGGRGYWPYGVEQARAAVTAGGGDIVFLPGDDQPDADLLALSSVDEATYHAIWRYFVEGGIDNSENLLRFVYEFIDAPGDWHWEPAKPLVKAGIYWPDGAVHTLHELQRKWVESQPCVGITFYRSLIQAGNTAVVDALVQALLNNGLNPLPLYVSSLKEAVSSALITELMGTAKVDLVINATGFAVSAPGSARTETPFDALDVPVLQTIFAGGGEEGWRDGTAGLGPRDIAMNIALPEVDGRIIGRAISFKGTAGRDEATQFDPVDYLPVPDRVAFTAELAARWVRLRRKEPGERRLGLIMANYPNKDARLGNGVGLDTPAGVVEVLTRLAEDGYQLDGAPKSAAEVIEAISSGPTNDFAALSQRKIRVVLETETYKAAFARLPKIVRQQVTERWGPPEADPFHVDRGFALSVVTCGHVVIGLQPARGYNIDPVESYHSPDLVPPHNYFAFYIWLREVFGADALVHMGKHGNMEWLPGKSLALSEECFPEAVFGPLPHLYPFIVNDPGEGTQAKRRAQAVIIDHLTPPLTRAESYGPLKDLEQLVDEYFDAAALDPRRLLPLKREILSLSATIGLDKDCGIAPDEDEEEALAKLDNYLCELKELQIRDGLHIFGRAPEAEQLTDLLVALARLPRGNGKGGNQSLHRAIAEDLQLDFDPLSAELGEVWTGPTPDLLAGSAPWRTHGDTVERIELLARELVAGQTVDLRRTAQVLDHIETELRPAVTGSGQAELDGLMQGLAGRFVAPGPSGAPTRGRPEVLPTGRNFYSVDTRSVPTPAAWELGWKSARLLLERHVQDQGDWPAALALTAWGTSNMRTGGDDIAQALALMGVRPTWDAAARRVTGFEVMPVETLGRPRVDVTLRISGFFRDAFPGLIDLVDGAARAVAELDEPAHLNPAAARFQTEWAEMTASGLDAAEARTRAGFRVFGSKPGAYGAGLQALIDEKGWESAADLAEAYLTWGSYAYGAKAEGAPARGLFEQRLKSVDGVVQNQDNREHDLLDSDDYYQFEGGITAAVRELTGTQPAIYHADHSRPENPRIHSLEEEIARVVRARVVNPKWIAGVRRHGYKGAFEMAATVDYLFAFSATAQAVGDHHFDAVFDAYLDDEEVRRWLDQVNPNARLDIADRLAEAIERGLWVPRRNSVHALLNDWKREETA